ncbi:MAG: M48 family metalloprotease [Pseudomonadota bacterium]
MFANLLYFLVALVIYTTTDLFGPIKEMDENAVLNSVLLSMVFVLICKISFDRLAKKTHQTGYGHIDHWVGIYINRLSILALIVFAINLYGFKLYLLFSGNVLFERIPTIEAILFLSLFLFYLIAIWGAAYKIQKEFFAGKVSRKDFILSNVSFSLPALLPWFVLSIVADGLGLLPWPPFQTFLKSPAGEVAYIALFFAAVAIFGPVVIKKIWNCKPLEPGYARTRIEYLCKKVGLKYSDILMWNLFGGTMITAGVMGLVGRFRYILVTPALLNSLAGDELDAVMLHEIGHVQKHHMAFYLLFFAGFVACNFVLFEPVLFLLYVLEPVYRMFEIIGIDKSTAHPILFSATLIMAFIIYFRFIFGFFMRNFERQADLHLYNFTSDASSLISTFYKIASSSKQSMEKPNWHHFSIGQRVRFLEKCQINPSLIQIHHSKVKKIMVGYLVMISLVFTMGYLINYGPAKENFEQFIAKKMLFQKMAVDPGNADIYVLVGDYYYHQTSYQKAIEAYENVLKLAPENIHALNNLAWLLATCPDKLFRNNEKAVIYAQNAVALQREDFILDTYAEALFANNDIEQAVIIAREALGLAKSKKDYYESQLERFEKQLTN